MQVNVQIPNGVGRGLAGAALLQREQARRRQRHRNRHRVRNLSLKSRRHLRRGAADFVGDDGRDLRRRSVQDLRGSIVEGYFRAGVWVAALTEQVRGLSHK